MMGHSIYDPEIAGRPAWNAGHKLGAKRPLKPKEVWSIRFWLEQQRRLRDRALFDLAIDSKLRGCDLVKMQIGDVVTGGRIRSRATVVQQKTGRPVQFELLEPARNSLREYLERRGGAVEAFVFPSRTDDTSHLSTRQYARLVGGSAMFPKSGRRSGALPTSGLRPDCGPPTIVSAVRATDRLKSASVVR